MSAPFLGTGYSIPKLRTDEAKVAVIPERKITGRKIRVVRKYGKYVISLH
ncbi:hypothetical protein MHA01_18310 [Marinococcus halophilus]|uniref:Uncharacterized protein n=1 Tax=Marinococcus halophilus TaxID=1371 RepID=A0A510Y6C0_MARHA|nr:hypothetical protein MHA01_18310 [Marinococcus halophilus]